MEAAASELMDVHKKLLLASLSCVLLIQVASSDGTAEGAGTTSWACVCTAHPLACRRIVRLPAIVYKMMMVAQDHGTAHVLLTKPLKKNTLRYMIGAASLTVTAHPEGKKHVSNKTVIVTLLVCVILTTIAFLGTTAYYLRRKDALSPHSHAYSFDKYTSWSSRSNLVSHRSSPLPQPKPKPRISVLKEFLCSCNPICGNEGGLLPGVIVRFSYSELEQATGKFSDEHLIGVGGTSKVYRGQLSDAKVIAVKKLRPLGGADEDFEFLSEVELLSRLNHCHVVPLLGYCMESQGRQLERLLVFECMGNGNLRDCLDLKQGRKAMDWATRVGVALGAARGVEYLHEAAAPRILHRDIKSTNILLDDKFRAKITDLGMAKCLMNDGVTSCSSSPARMLGTFGYFAPEYAIVGKASLKSDVFSFGVVILELITGRQPIHHHRPPAAAGESLVLWAAPRLRDSRLVVAELPDPALQGRFPQEEMQIMAHLARECLQWEPESRPTMSEVVQILATIAPSSRKHAAAATLVTRIGRSSSAGDTMHSTRLAVKCSVGESWRSPEMEEETVVDLTEPRLEPAIFFN
uniref:non-specific serine/threonine protein kinase n=1 Tax=Oryza glumipatula TaxID=40148 RepID=A0A0D9YL82_9ORYZ